MKMRNQLREHLCLAGLVAATAGVVSLSAQAPVAQAAPTAAVSIPSKAGGITPPADYVIGPDDQLSIVFWRDRDMSADVVVRPDGKISLPLLNEVQAAGLTPNQLRENISDGAKRFMQEPNATVLVKQINSRKVFITGAVERPGAYPLNGPTAVLQLIATAGGVKEYADARKILILRNEPAHQVAFTFNYKDVISQKNLQQNIQLKPGDTIIVP